MTEMNANTMTPDLEAIRGDLESAAQKRISRNRRRRGMAKTATLATGALLAISGSALAAGSATGVINAIDLPGGGTAEEIPAPPPGTLGADKAHHYKIEEPAKDGLPAATLNWHTNGDIRTNPDAVGEGTVELHGVPAPDPDAPSGRIHFGKKTVGIAGQ
jgi:hypothetical protein